MEGPRLKIKPIDAFSLAGKTAFWDMVVFIGVLAAGLGYAWKKGVLQWRR